MIRFAAFDLAYAHVGMVRGTLTPDGVIAPDYAQLVVTADHIDASARKVTRRSSEELARARVIVSAISAWVFDTTVVFAEVPSGSQSARAARALGIAVGCLASCPVPVIEVTPLEVKLASTNKRTASKAEIIDWAYKLAPDLPWRQRKLHGKMVMTSDNEHIADALAVAYAGVRTPDFQRLMALMRVGGGVVPTPAVTRRRMFPKK